MICYIILHTLWHAHHNISFSEEWNLFLIPVRHLTCRIFHHYFSESNEVLLFISCLLSRWPNTECRHSAIIVAFGYCITCFRLQCLPWLARTLAGISLLNVNAFEKKRCTNLVSIKQNFLVKPNISCKTRRRCSVRRENLASLFVETRYLHSWNPCVLHNILSHEFLHQTSHQVPRSAHTAA